RWARSTGRAALRTADDAVAGPARAPSVRTASAGRSLSAPLPVDDPAQLLPDDAGWLSAVAGGAGQVSCRESGADPPRRRLRRADHFACAIAGAEGAAEGGRRGADA